MNRYEKFVPLKLNYRPFIPNIDKWAETLKQQQARYDEFNKTVDYLESDSIIDPEYSNAWNTYRENLKKEIKSGFAKGINEGNSLMKDKMTELMSQAKTGLYGDIEKRKSEFSAAIKELEDGIKDQSVERQAYYRDQFKYKKSLYTDGKYNQIKAPKISKDPETEKRFQEWTSKLKPEEIENTWVEFNKAQTADGKETSSMYDEHGNLTPASQWILTKTQGRKGMDKNVYQALAKQFITVNPDIQEDLKIKAWYKDRNLSPEDKEKLVDNYKTSKIKELEEEREEALKDPVSIGLFNKKFFDKDDQTLIPDLKNKIENFYKEQISEIEDAEMTSFGIFREGIEESLINTNYSMIESKKVNKVEMKENPYYLKAVEDQYARSRMNIEYRLKQNLEAQKARYRMAEKEREYAAALQQRQFEEGITLENPIPSQSSEGVLLNSYTKKKEEAEQAKKSVLDLMSPFVLSNTSGAVKQSLVKPIIEKIENLRKDPKYNQFNNLPPYEQTLLLSRYGLAIVSGQDKTPLALKRAVEDLYTAYSTAQIVNSEIESMSPKVKESLQDAEEELKRVYESSNWYETKSFEEWKNKINNGETMFRYEKGNNIANIAHFIVQPATALAGLAWDAPFSIADYNKVVNKHLSTVEKELPLLTGITLTSNSDRSTITGLNKAANNYVVNLIESNSPLSNPVLSGQPATIHKSVGSDKKLVTWKGFKNNILMNTVKGEIGVFGGKPVYTITAMDKDNASYTTVIAIPDNHVGQLSQEINKAISLARDPESKRALSTLGASLTNFYQKTPFESEDPKPIAHGGIDYKPIKMGGHWYLGSNANGEFKPIQGLNGQYITGDSQEDIYIEMYQMTIPPTIEYSGTQKQVQAVNEDNDDF